jgi:hypothetical protein
MTSHVSIASAISSSELILQAVVSILPQQQQQQQQQQHTPHLAAKLLYAISHHTQQPSPLPLTSLLSQIASAASAILLSVSDNQPPHHELGSSSCHHRLDSPHHTASLLLCCLPTSPPHVCLLSLPPAIILLLLNEIKHMAFDETAVVVELLLNLSTCGTRLPQGSAMVLAQLMNTQMRDDRTSADVLLHSSVITTCELLSRLVADADMVQDDDIIVTEAAVKLVLAAHEALAGRSSKAAGASSSSTSTAAVVSPLVRIQSIAEHCWSILSSIVRAEARDRAYSSVTPSKPCAEHLVGNRDLLQLLQDVIGMSPLSVAAGGITQRILSEGAVLALNLFISGVSGAARIDIANALRMEAGKAAAASSSMLLHTLILQLTQGDARAMAGAARCLTSIIAAFSGDAQPQQQQQQQPQIIRSILVHPSFSSGFTSCLKLALTTPSVRSIILAFAHTVCALSDALTLLPNVQDVVPALCLFINFQDPHLLQLASAALLIVLRAAQTRTIFMNLPLTSANRAGSGDIASAVGVGEGDLSIGGANVTTVTQRLLQLLVFSSSHSSTNAAVSAAAAATYRCCCGCLFYVSMTTPGRAAMSNCADTGHLLLALQHRAHGDLPALRWVTGAIGNALLAQLARAILMADQGGGGMQLPQLLVLLCEEDVDHVVTRHVISCLARLLSFPDTSSCSSAITPTAAHVIFTLLLLADPPSLSPCLTVIAHLVRVSARKPLGNNPSAGAFSGVLDRFSNSPEAFRIIQKALTDTDTSIVAAAAAAAAAAAEADSLRNVWLRGMPVSSRDHRVDAPPENLLPSLAKLLTTSR